jgi:DNA-binding NarL/FixJ family response regulator
MKIVIVDDDPIVCSSLKSIIEITGRTAQPSNDSFEVVATGLDGTEAVTLYETHRPDILLLDIQMKQMSGLDAAKIILDKHPKAKILFLTTFLDEAYILDALRIGAKGYLMKTDVSSILPALIAISKGQRVFGDEIVDKIPHMMTEAAAGPESEDQIRQHSAFSSLSGKEWAITRLVAQGKNNKEIADELHFSEGTVRNYLSTILEKLDLRDRTQLAVTYYKEGFS